MYKPDPTPAGRLDEQERRPQVTRIFNGRLVLEMTPDEAPALAQVLVHYDALVHQSATQLEPQMFRAPDLPHAPALRANELYDARVWPMVSIDLFTEVARYGEVAETVDVDTSRVASLRGPVRPVGPRAVR